MAALAVVALTGRTQVGLSDEDPGRHPVIEELPGEGALVEEFLAITSVPLIRIEVLASFFPERESVVLLV